MGSNEVCSSHSGMGGQQELRICPKCMEEMDLTDQELQPCICGYEICLWCWHFIIQTAAKDGGDGARCPACHSPYDMERILKKTISKERLEIGNVHKKPELPKTNKPRPTDSGKDLKSVRVIRRNIVYIAGIPKKTSNEKTLRKKEFLGQYGKIVKICFAQTDVSRQYYSSDSCIVYATFSMEEEALRCIQVVNGYILDGRPLKASFGTTRYCYSWLNNLPCKNPDCLYVHDVVPQEDICSREEVISVCTSKLQQCPGIALTNLKQHSGSSFPPPLDTKNSLLPPLGLIGSSNRYIQSDYIGRSYATVASSRNQSKIFTMNGDLVMPSSRAEVYFPSRTGDHNHASFNSLTNIGWKCESLGSIAQNFSSEWNDLGSVSRKFDPFLSSQTPKENALPSYGWSRLHSDLASANFSFSHEDERISPPFGGKSNDFPTFSAISSNLHSSSSSNSGPDFEYSCADEARDKNFLNQFHSDLGSSSKKSKDFPIFSTIATKSCRKLDDLSAISPTEPMLCRRPSSNGGPDIEFTPADKSRDEKFLTESYIDDWEDRILSDIFSLDLDSIDDPGDSRSVLEQRGGSDGLPRMSNSSLPFTGDGSKSYFLMMDDLYAATGHLPAWSNGASGLTSKSSCSEFMANKEGYTGNSYLETSKNSKVLSSISLLSASEAVTGSGSSLDILRSGSSLSGPHSQHPCSNSTTRRTTLSTPPGFPPRKTIPGSRFFSDANATSSSHADYSKTSSSSKGILPSHVSSVNNASQNPNLATGRRNSPHMKDRIDSVSSNAIDLDRNLLSLSTISSVVVPELQNRSYF